jgi:hypothetical protein
VLSPRRAVTNARNVWWSASTGPTTCSDADPSESYNLNTNIIPFLQIHTHFETILILQRQPMLTSQPAGGKSPKTVRSKVRKNSRRMWQRDEKPTCSKRFADGHRWSSRIRPKLLSCALHFCLNHRADTPHHQRSRTRVQIPHRLRDPLHATRLASPGKLSTPMGHEGSRMYADRYPDPTPINCRACSREIRPQASTPAQKSPQLRVSCSSATRLLAARERTLISAVHLQSRRVLDKALFRIRLSCPGNVS